jgi:hypothetical protein
MNVYDATFFVKRKTFCDRLRHGHIQDSWRECVSDPNKNLMEIYDDIDLCYKVMGLTFSDPPDKVDSVYKELVDKYTRESHGADLERRQGAQVNLEQVHDLYERITSSLIYKDYAREYEKYKQLKAEQNKGKKKPEAEKPPEMMRCPYCDKQISAKLKECIYCHGKILTPMEMLMKKFFSTRNMIIVSVVLVLIIAGVVIALNPQLLK